MKISASWSLTWVELDRVYTKHHYLNKHWCLIVSLLLLLQTSSLQYLDARNTPLLDHSAPFVARALRISGSLAVLHLENAGLSGRPLMLLGKIGKAPGEWKKSCTKGSGGVFENAKIKNLIFCSEDCVFLLVYPYFLVLSLLATALKMNMNLRELYLADNKLNGLQDSAQLGNLLKFNYNIQILDLRNNHILDSGMQHW